MSFSEYAKALSPLLAGRASNGAFAYTLFQNITDNKSNELEKLYVGNESTFRHYFNGTRQISSIAPIILKNLDKECFESYIDSFPADVLDNVYTALSPAWPAMSSCNVSHESANLFERILLTASKIRRGKKPHVSTPIGEDDIEFLKEELLLNETGLRCPMCGNRLLSGGERNPVKHYEIVSITPIAYDYKDKVKYEDTGFAFPEPNSLMNFITLCSICASEYRLNPTPETYKQLMLAKQQINTQAKLTDTLDRLDIEDGIVDLLDSLRSLNEEFDFTEASNNAITIAKKIRPEERLLANEVCNNVILYYRFIEERLQQLDAEENLDFELLQTQIHGCFLKLEKAGLSQSEIIESMTKWLEDKTGTKDVLACRIVIAFFIQACEVFREITE